MEINGIGGIQRIGNNSKVSKVDKVKNNRDIGTDNVQISEEAKKLAEIAKYEDLIKNSPDIREDKIAEVKAKLENGEYDREEVLREVAEKLMKVLGL